MLQRHGSQQSRSGLEGHGLLQSPAEWEVRNATLAVTLGDLIVKYCDESGAKALDVGCQHGELTDRLAQLTGLVWTGAEPDLLQETTSPSGARLVPGFAHDLPFGDNEFDVINFANVFEHVAPAARTPSLGALYRVLRPAGILVGQLPNPYFPIESHSRLPFFGWVPRRWQPIYWRLSPTGWDFEAAHFFSVTVEDLRQVAEGVGFNTVLIRTFNYPPEAVPQAVRWAARLHNKLDIFPWSWQFVFRKPLHREL